MSYTSDIGLKDTGCEGVENNIYMLEIRLFKTIFQIIITSYYLYRFLYFHTNIFKCMFIRNTSIFYIRIHYNLFSNLSFKEKYYDSTNTKLSALLFTLRRTLYLGKYFLL